MCLVALQDPGLTVFSDPPLVRGLDGDQQEALATALRRDFDIRELGDRSQLAPEAGDEIRIGYLDAHSRRPFMLNLKDRAIADAALPDRPSLSAA